MLQRSPHRHLLLRPGNAHGHGTTVIANLTYTSLNQPYELQMQGLLYIIQRLPLRPCLRQLWLRSGFSINHLISLFIGSLIIQALPQTTVVEQRLLNQSFDLALHWFTHYPGPASDKGG